MSFIGTHLCNIPPEDIHADIVKEVKGYLDILEHDLGSDYLYEVVISYEPRAYMSITKLLSLAAIDDFLNTEFINTNYSCFDISIRADEIYEIRIMKLKIDNSGLFIDYSKPLYSNYIFTDISNGILVNCNTIKKRHNMNKLLNKI